MYTLISSTTVTMISWKVAMFCIKNRNVSKKDSVTMFASAIAIYIFIDKELRRCVHLFKYSSLQGKVIKIVII